MTISRRDFNRMLSSVPLTLAAGQFANAQVTEVNGVIFGIETFSFHDLPPAGDTELIPTII